MTTVPQLNPWNLMHYESFKTLLYVLHCVLGTPINLNVNLKVQGLGPTFLKPPSFPLTLLGLNKTTMFIAKEGNLFRIIGYGTPHPQNFFLFSNQNTRV